LRIFFHDACFDGTAAAALFASFYRSVIDPDVRIEPVGMIHKDGDPFAETSFDADDHACVDFRFCGNPRMRWWFDHHATAFQPSVLRERFDSADVTQRATWVFDASAPSCTGLLARELLRGWSFRAPEHLRDVITWADTIDAASFPTAAAATALDEPAQQVAAWLAHGRSASDTANYILALSQQSIADIAQTPDMRRAITEISDERVSLRNVLRATAFRDGNVVVFDRLLSPGARSPGFLGYQLYPDAVYSISATCNDSSIKISVGLNPWTTAQIGPRKHIGQLCESLGGGAKVSIEHLIAALR
jgi:hypothetical protein